MFHTYIHIGSTSKVNPFQDIFNKEIFMESSKKLVYSSSTRLSYQEALEVQAWLEEVQRIEGNCLIDGYVSSLPKEVHVDLTQNKLTKLVGLWELVSGPNKRKFHNLYGQIASLIMIEVDEPLIRATIQF